MFSGFSLPLFLLLLLLIVRGVAFEYRSKVEVPKWRGLWDWCIFLASLLAPFLLAVALANIVRGVPIDADMNYVGGFFNLLNPYALLAGVAAVVIFAFYGAIFLSLKTKGEVEAQAAATTRRLWLLVIVVLVVFLVATYFSTDIVSQLGVNLGVIPFIGMAAILLAGYFCYRNMFGWAFSMTALTIGVIVVTLFLILYPRVMVSSIDPAYSLTIYNASSSDYTLQVMTIVAVIFVPIVLIYQGWSYWVFRQRLTADSHLEY
jgi:cytochrome d ubiquinol oxidase subunit II